MEIQEDYNAVDFTRQDPQKKSYCGLFRYCGLLDTVGGKLAILSHDPGLWRDEKQRRKVFYVGVNVHV